jgi:hypothetical protein
MVIHKADKKNADYYLKLPWTYTIETAKDEEGNNYYIVYVNELPRICTDASTYLSTSLGQ